MAMLPRRRAGEMAQSGGMTNRGYKAGAHVEAKGEKWRGLKNSSSEERRDTLLLGARDFGRRRMYVCVFGWKGNILDFEAQNWSFVLLGMHVCS